MRRCDPYYDCEYEEYLLSRRQAPPRHHWGFIPWVMLLGALLFGCGYLFGCAGAAEREDARRGTVSYTVPVQTSAPSETPGVTPIAPPVSGDVPKAADEGWALTRAKSWSRESVWRSIWRSCGMRENLCLTLGGQSCTITFAQSNTVFGRTSYGEVA